jgi:hypothetical protein
MSNGYGGTIRLAKENPNFKDPLGNIGDWLIVVKTCYDVSEKTKEFAGSWIANKSWFPSLRTLAKYGIVEKTDTTRGGRRAYYIVPDRDGVGKALKELGYL